MTEETFREDQIPEAMWEPRSGGLVIDGRYLLGPPLAAGGMGTVYEARHLTMGYSVALKLSTSARPEVHERMVREAQIAAQVADEGVVRILDMGRYVNGSYIAMERLEGRDLGELIDRRGPLPVNGACSIITGVASTFGRMHALGIVHRDLKPANVFLCDGGAVKVVDFGLAKDLTQPGSLTDTGVTMGTPAFMAPEQVIDSSRAGPAADCYALGGLLFFALTGTEPHDAASPDQKLMQAIVDDVTPLDRLRPDAPGWLVELVAALLDKDPDTRPSAAATAEALSTKIL